MPEPDLTACPNIDALVDYNRQRNAKLTPRVVELARRALNKQCDGLTDKERAVLQLRVDHPDDTLTELAARAGITKHACSGALRRVIDRVQLNAESVSA